MAVGKQARRPITAPCDPERGEGSGPPPPPKNHKNIGLPSSAGLDSLKNQGSIQYWAVVDPTSETPYQWRFPGEPMMAGF